jgi:hypothetical protein
VFDQRFDDKGNPTPTSDSITKIFPLSRKAAADREYALAAKIRNILGEGTPGVVLSTSSRELPTVNDTITMGNACAELSSDIAAGKSGFPALEQPRALRDMVAESIPYAARFYKQSYDALKALTTNGIVHLDIARRNIFVVKSFESREDAFFGEQGKREMAAVGDFGSILDLADDQRNDAVIALAKAGVNSLVNCKNKDGSTFSANICIAMEFLMRVSPETVPEFQRDLAALKDPSRYHIAIDDPVHERIKEWYQPELTDLISKLTASDIPLDECVKLANHHMRLSDCRMLTILMIKNRCGDADSYIAEAWAPTNTVADALAARLAALRRGGMYLPSKYFKGLSTRKARTRRTEITRRARMKTSDPKAYRPFKTDTGVKTRKSSYTERFHRKYPGVTGLPAIAKATGVPLSTLKTVYDRGMAAWRTGHRPGASQQAWGIARVYSFVLKGTTYHTADADLAKTSRGKE